MSLFIEVGGVVADPRAHIKDYKTGVGLRLALGLRTRYFVGYAGQRKIWTGDSEMSGGEVIRADITSSEFMVGGRLSLSVSRWALLYVDLYWSVVELEAEYDGRSTFEFADGSGWGTRIGVEMPIAKHIGATVAVGAYYADARVIDDPIRIGWLSGELAIVGSL